MLAIYSATNAGTSSESRIYVSQLHSNSFPAGLRLRVLHYSEATHARLFTKQSLVLQAANGTPITIFSIYRLILDLGLRWPFQWPFVIAGVHTVILGADALKYHGLIIDLRHHCLLDDLTSFPLICALGPAPQIHIISTASFQLRLRRTSVDKY